jgi:flagellar assembly protein FliH
VALPFELPTLEAIEPVAPEQLPSAEDPSPLALLEQARAEAQQLRDAAREAGHAEGLELGRAAAAEEVRTALSALTAAAAALAAARDETVARTEAAAVELALRLAEKVVSAALEIQPERVLDAVRGALRCLAERERVQVFVHPDDLAVVRDGVGAIADELGGIEHLEVQQERRVARGDAIVRTAEAEIDARVAEKLEHARKAVAAELRP